VSRQFNDFNPLKVEKWNTRLSPLMTTGRSEFFIPVSFEDFQSRRQVTQNLIK